MDVNKDFEAAVVINHFLQRGMSLMDIYYYVAGRAMKACLDEDDSRLDHLVTIDVMVRSSKMLLGLATDDKGVAKIFSDLAESDYKPVVEMTDKEQETLFGSEEQWH